ncbi:MAG: hypothetical protein WCO07_03225 [bacterium]
MLNKFFGSKFNSVLLLVLIILIVIAVCIMFRGGKDYFNFSQKQAPIEVIDKTQIPIPKVGLLGNKDDLISFSIWPKAKVHGIVSYRGAIKGGYFFEANILINILDSNKKVLKRSNGVAKTDWMTTSPVEFEGNIDFTGLPNGPAYFEIHNDNASGLPENNKSVLIPIIIE